MNGITHPKDEVYQYQNKFDQAAASGQTHVYRICITFRFVLFDIYFMILCRV